MSSSESTNLTQNGESADMGDYFSSPELSQRADLLRHLTENSNLIPLIRGVEGMGKSTFIQHLLDLAPENWIPVEINADVMLQPDALLANLAGLFDQDDRSERLIDDLIMHFEDLRHDGFLPVIIVDDAHLLPEASIIALLRLHEKGTEEVPLAQILLFAEPEIDDLLKTPQLRVMNLQSLQLLDMPEFTLEQTELYLDHLLSSEESSSIKPLTDSQIEIIHAETGGSPGLIKQEAQKFIGSTKKAMTASNLPNYFSSKSFIGGGLVAIMALLILIYQDDINAIFSGEKEAIDTTQRQQIETEGAMPLNIPDSEKVVVEEQEMAKAEPVDQDVSGDMEIAEGKEADLGPIPEEEVEKIVEAVGEPEKQAPKPEIVQEKPEPKSAAPQQPEKASQPKKVEKPATESVAIPEKKDVPEPVPVEKKVVENAAPSEKKPSKQVEVKEQVKKEEPKANKIVSPAKPEKKQEVAPKKPEVINKPVKIAEVRQKLTTPPVTPVTKMPVPKVTEPAKAVEPSSSAPAQQTAGPTPAPVEDRSTMLAKDEVPAINVTDKPKEQIEKKPIISTQKPAVIQPKTASSRFLREGWLLKQKPSSYTIQLVGLQDEKGIAGFIRRHSVRGPVAYYRTKRNGKAWFPVLYGAYSSRSRAIEARNKLPNSLLKSGTWMRTLNSVQKDIRAR